jgi:predicted Zn finger-like uncharacterized protein
LKISCPSCAASYELDDSRVPAAGLSIKCPKCKSPFTVHKGEGGKASIKSGAGVPAAGKPVTRPITKPVVKKPPTGPVALPGLDESARPGGAVPLPGTGEPRSSPSAAPPAFAASSGGAVPLPGLSQGAPLDKGVDLALDLTSRDADRETVDDVEPQAAGRVPLPGLDDRFAEGPLDPAVSAAPEVAATPADPFAAAPPPDDEFAVEPARRPPTDRSVRRPAPSRVLPEEDDLLDPFANIELGAPMPAKGAQPAAPGTDGRGAGQDDDFALDLKRSGAARPPPGKTAFAAGDDLGFGSDAVTPKVEDAVVPKPAQPSQVRRSPDMDLLDFVEDLPIGDEPAKEPSKSDKGRRPPPPVLAKGAARAEPPTLNLDFPDAGPAGAAGGEEKGDDAKKSEKARKKREREERVAGDREERARRKALRRENAQGGIRPLLTDAAEALSRPRALALAAGALALGVVVVLGILAGRSSEGFFWINRILPSKRAVTAAEVQVIEKGIARLGQGDFAGAREAVASGAELLGAVPNDDDVKAFFVLAASELKLEYGQSGADWEQATRVIDRIKSTRPPQMRARAAFALASGDVPKGRQLLAGIADAPNADLESTWLHAQSLIKGGDAVRAASVLDAALKARPTAVKLLLLRGSVAAARGQPAEAADFFQRVLKQSPDNGRALVELAAARQAQKDDASAAELLARALDTDVRKTLDAAEEARANMLRGNLAVAERDPKAAEAAYERGLLLDPTSAPLREAYGRFRLSRRDWDKAARQFEAAIASGKATAEAYAGAAAADLGMNRLLEADKQINQAVAKDGSNAHYIYLQGRVAEAIGKGDEAYRRYETALAKKPTSGEALAAEGQMMILRGDKAKAKEKLTAALTIPDGTRTRSEDEAVGDLALALGEKASAQALFSAALAADPNDPVAHAGLGKALAAQGDAAAAKKELELALAQVDSDAGIQFEYGSVLRQLGQSDTALEALRKAVKIDGKEARYRARLGAILVERGQFEEAERELRQAVLLDGRLAEAQFFLGRALDGRKSLTEAIDALHRSVEIAPENADYWYWLGVVYEHGQQIQDAIDSLQKAIDRNPKSADALEHLGLDLMVENRFADAVAAFKRAAEIDPNRARLWGEVADAEQQSGDVDGAIRDFERALKQDPKLPGVWTRLGVAFKDKDCKGCRARAEDALQHGIQVDAKDATAHHELGYMYKDDGKRKLAIAEFQKYLELHPDAGDAATVQDDIYYLQEESRRAP